MKTVGRWLSEAGHELDRISARPNLAALLYPVITMEDPFVHRTSFWYEPT